MFFNFLDASSCQKKLFDINIIEEVSIEESLEQLASMCSFSIILKDKMAKEKITQIQKYLNVKNMSLTDILNLLIKENNLHYTFDDKVLKISGISTQTFKINYITSVREGQSVTKASVDIGLKHNNIGDTGSEDNMIRSLEKFDFWENIREDLLALLNSSNEEYEAKPPIINPNTGLVTVSATQNQLLRVQEYLQNLEQRLKKQVIIDVSIIAVNLNESHSSGINWQNFNIDFNSQRSDLQNSYLQFDSTKDNLFVKNLGFRMGINFDSVMNFLSQNGKTNVLSNPKLMALNNQQAIISIGDTINYQVKESSKSTESGTTVSESFNNYSIFIGILLNILPEISDDDKIILRINPSLSDFKYPQDSKRRDMPREIAPDTTQKKLSTVVQVDNNQTLILGGLISKNTAIEESSVKFFSDIPLLGSLFRGTQEIEQNTEIVFIITPLIVKNEIYTPSLKDLGFTHYE